jgi:succinyl-diaminopimelate desuccinylase
MLGDTIKIGRRGSLNGTLTVKGTQGHVAYPHKADNPIPKMLQLLDTLNACVLDDGYPGFQPSHLEITSIDVGNLATNIIPAGITANFNVRFNPSYTQQSLKQHLQKTLHTTHIDHSLEFAEGAEPFIIKEHPGMRIMKQAVHETTKIPSEYSTSGGTSDARFIQKIAPVIEFGLLNNLAHKIDEHVSIKDLEMLTEIYKRFIALYFKTIF